MKPFVRTSGLFKWFEYSLSYKFQEDGRQRWTSRSVKPFHGRDEERFIAKFRGSLPLDKVSIFFEIVRD